MMREETILKNHQEFLRNKVPGFRRDGGMNEKQALEWVAEHGNEDEKSIAKYVISLLAWIRNLRAAVEWSPWTKWTGRTGGDVRFLPGHPYGVENDDAIDALINDYAAYARDGRRPQDMEREWG